MNDTAFKELPRKYFDPDRTPEKNRVYHFHDVRLIEKINEAVALSRPLLLTGEAGMGKSAVAEAVAKTWDGMLLRRVIKSRSEAEDLKYDFDALDRLSDASAHAIKEKSAYVTPGPLWCAYDPQGARDFLASQQASGVEKKKVETPEPGAPRVVLIDELDKADLDFANDLLDIFDEGRFDVRYADLTVSLKDRDKLLIVITSNGERQFSEAFRRRCVNYEIKGPKPDEAFKVAEAILRRLASSHKGPSQKWLLEKDRIEMLAHHCLDDSRTLLRVARFADLLKAVIAFGKEHVDDTIASLTRRS